MTPTTVGIADRVETEAGVTTLFRKDVLKAMNPELHSPDVVHADAWSTEVSLGDELLHAARCVEEALNNMTMEAGVNEARFVVLDALRRHRPNGCSQTTLASELKQSESNLSTLLDRMSKDGLIERRRHPHDRRKCLIALTHGGELLLTKARTYRDVVLAELLRQLPGDMIVSGRTALLALSGAAESYVRDPRRRLLREQELAAVANSRLKRFDELHADSRHPHIAEWSLKSNPMTADEVSLDRNPPQFRSELPAA
jgi:DNA-binding MarR family transcriptional regulator